MPTEAERLENEIKIRRAERRVPQAVREMAKASGRGKAPGIAERAVSAVKDYVSRSVASAKGSLSANLREFKRSPGKAAMRHLRSIPHGRKVASVLALAGVGAGAGYAAHKEAEKDKPTRAKSAPKPGIDEDVPLIPGVTSDDPPAKAKPKPQERKPTQRRSQESGKPVGRQSYPVYAKGSSKAADFRAAFAAARKAGKAVFEWEGRKYNTKLKGEK